VTSKVEGSREYKLGDRKAKNKTQDRNIPSTPPAKTPCPTVGGAMRNPPAGHSSPSQFGELFASVQIVANDVPWRLGSIRFFMRSSLAVSELMHLDSYGTGG
jgi:hypothetical protein